MIRYENDSQRRIEALLIRILAAIEGNSEAEKDVQKALDIIESEKSENNIGGWNFL